jgi:hypothetical protein
MERHRLKVQVQTDNLSSAKLQVQSGNLSAQNFVQSAGSGEDNGLAFVLNSMLT